MFKPSLILVLTAFLFSCQPQEKKSFDQRILSSLGSKHRIEWEGAATEFQAQIDTDSTNVDALVGLAETNIIIYLFGFTSRDQTIPTARAAIEKALKQDSTSSNVLAASAKLKFLDWQWQESKETFEAAIKADRTNNDVRHWYSLWLSAMGKHDEAMMHSDTIMTMDPNGNFLIGRGSLLYFEHRFEELKEMMIIATEADPMVPWGYDWLGMAYNGLEEHDDAIETYFKAFELSDGTVEVGAGLGHALGLAGEKELAKEMADYYEMAAKDHYLPQVQRAFVHLGIQEHDEAIALLEEAYEAKSWFIIFMQIEPWYDPIRDDQRFQDIMVKMSFPTNN